jgi:hypothetical protein
MKLRGSLKVVPALLITLSLFTACGKVKYQKTEISASAVAGQYTKPKIDIVIFQDNSDSMNVPIQYIKPQLVNFLNSINSSWDYHFTVMPLLYKATMSQKYMASSDCTGLQNCISASQFNSALGDTGWINSNIRNGSNDFGLEYMRQNLTDPGMMSSGFLRSDAALASILVSDGNDISTVHYTQNAGGQTIIDVNATNAGLSTYINFIAGFKPSALMSKFYAVIAPGNSNDLTQCYGTQVFGSGSYSFVSSALGIKNSLAYNICSGSALTGVMNDIGGQLQALVAAYQFNYVVVNDEPDVSTIKITKNGSAISQSSMNGWTYVGYRSNQATSFSPAASNVKSGYMIQLTGSAIYSGTDMINVTYKAK